MNALRMILVDDNEARRAATACFLEARGRRVKVLDALPDLAAPAEAPDEPVVLIVALKNARSRLIPGIGALKQSCPSLVVIALAPAEAAEALLAFLEHGVLDHISPLENPACLYSAVRCEEIKADLARKAEAQLKDLRRLKKEHGADLRKVLEIEEMHETTLENFMTALDLRDVETYGHSKTVARYTHVLAEAMGIRDSRTLDNFRKGALLHDAGKIAIPDSILKKPGPLTPQEWEKIKRHPVLGYGLIKDVKLLKEVGNIILCHHEKYDGSGYPRGLKGSAIPFEARIFAVADTLDAVTSHRPYRGWRDFGTAKKEIIRNAGAQFDPTVVDAFCGLDLAVWEKIRFETTRIFPSEALYRQMTVKD